jgi:hypothetical protein
MPLTPADIIRLASRLTSRDRHLAAALRGGIVVSEPSEMERALIDATAVLRSLGAPHALIGGLAVAIRAGVPRATLDVDLAVRSDIDKERLVAAFHAAGFALTGRFEHSINFAHSGGDPVQVAMDSGFDAAIDRAEPLPIGGTDILVARRDDLIALKERSANDPRRRRSKTMQDRTDIELLRGDVPGPDEGW